MSVIIEQGVITPTLRRPKKDYNFPHPATDFPKVARVLKCACPCGGIMWVYYSHKTPMFAMCDNECRVVYADTRIYSNITSKIQIIIGGRYPIYAQYMREGFNILSPVHTLPEIWQ